MSDEARHQRLSRITTHWTVVLAAGLNTPSDAREARRRILNLYGGAVHRYLLGALRSEEAADELFQEFASRFLEGRMKGADPGRGRFRDYVKGILFHMIADYRRQRGKDNRQVPLPDVVARNGAPADEERGFSESWSGEIMQRSWDYLKEVEQETGRPYYTVLHYRTEHPDEPSHVMAQHLASQLGKPLNAAGVRQILHRAREKFADRLVETVAHSLKVPSEETLEQELTELGLRKYCRSALGRWSQIREEAEPA